VVVSRADIVDWRPEPSGAMVLLVHGADAVEQRDVLARAP
jgi:hypothetical protein